MLLATHPLFRISIVAASLGLVLVGLAWHTRPDGYLHVFFLDTPGDAVLIQSPHGSHILIDGGADPIQLALHLGRRLPFWKRTLDAVVLSQGDDQRLPGQVAALVRYQASLALVAPGLPADNAYASEWKRLLREQRTPMRQAVPGQRLALGGAILTVLAAGDGSESGVIMRLDYGSTSVLFGGACGGAEDATLLATLPAATVLVYPWQRELSGNLLETWQPRAIIFTTAYQSDRPTLQTFFERAGGNAFRYQHLYHPELDGTIELVSDGAHTCIRREREEPCFNG